MRHDKKNSDLHGQRLPFKRCTINCTGFTELERREAAGEVLFELAGSFCQSQCADGVIVRVNGETYQHVTAADVPRLVEICLQGE